MKKFIAMLLVIMCVISLAACDLSGAITYDLGNADRANYYNRIYTEMVDKYGEAEMTADDTYGNVLTGVAVVRLIDFTGEGIYELYIAYADGTVPYVNKQLVVGFENGPATLIDEQTEFSDEITSKATADAAAPSLWLYKDNYGRAYIVTGEDLSKEAVYNTFIQTRGEEKVYSFDKEFSEVDGNELAGSYEKINLTGLTKEDADMVFEENEKVINSISGQIEKK